jgi:hypothetical protein
VVDRRIEDLPEDVREGNEIIDLNKTFTRIVYRVVDGKTVATPVKVGPSDLTQTVITEGLSADDVIVTGPFRILVDLKHDRAVKDQSKSDDDDAAEEDDSEDKAVDESVDEAEPEVETSEESSEESP